MAGGRLRDGIVVVGGETEAFDIGGTGGTWVITTDQAKAGVAFKERRSVAYL